MVGRCDPIEGGLTRRFRLLKPGGNVAMVRPPTAPVGRSQAVRQRILIPPFGGSIPPAPANLLELLTFFQVDVSRNTHL